MGLEQELIQLMLIQLMLIQLMLIQLVQMIKIGVCYVATGHFRNSGRKQWNRNGLTINQASIDDPPTDLKDAQIAAIISVNQMAQTSLDGLDTSGSQPAAITATFQLVARAFP